MNLQRFEDLLLGGKLQDARAAALDLVAHYDDEANSCTMAGEHGEATRAERKSDQLRQRLLEIEFRIELAGRGPFRCPRCATPGIPESSGPITKLTCSACGLVWDGEAELRLLDVERAPITITGRQVFIVGPPGRETGDEARLAWLLSELAPGPMMVAWSALGLTIAIPPDAPRLLVNGESASSRFTLSSGDSIEFGETRLRLR